MPNSLRYDEGLTRVEGHDSPRCIVRSWFQVDQQPTVDDIEEFVVARVLVPMVLALDDAESNDRIVHSNERLIVPRVTHRADDGIERNRLEGRTQDIEMRFVGECRGIRHEVSYEWVNDALPAGDSQNSIERAVDVVFRRLP